MFPRHCLFPIIVARRKPDAPALDLIIANMPADDSLPPARKWPERDVMVADEYLAHSLRSDKVNQYRDSLAQQCPSPPDFDFDQFLQGPYSSSPFSPSPTPPEYAHVEEASAAGDLPTVKRILDGWDTYMTGFGRAFTSAIKSGHLAVASCLLEHGLQIEGFHFRYALEQKSYPFMQHCLDHGYDLNDPDYPF
ncbi:MAG: hypothetical protein L6R42_007120 [Xanthoria sp. 1 TBL-2021]|nr:MAG: hypothetical protein L6R42_007120 [Xanthoria sp. 1 TBL-2021]